MIGRRRRGRKGPGLAPHIPMPQDATGTAAQLQPDLSLSAADLAALELAAAKVPVLGPAARSRGRHLAQAMRNSLGDEALRELLPHLHWMESVHHQDIFPATWGQHICAVLAACHELNGGGELPQWTDEQLGRLAETLRKDGEGK